MKQYHFILFLLIFYTDILSIAERNKTHERILNGDIWKEKIIPYQISLQSKTGVHFCGGTIIDMKHIITAAHCMFANNYKTQFSPDDIQVWAGKANLTDESLAIIKNIQHIFVHEEYNNRTHTNDIAVIRIIDDFNEFSYIKPIKLSAKYINESTCAIFGWGHYDEEFHKLSATMRYAQINISSNENCQENYSKFNITNTMICAGAENIEFDSCKGDSGGPLICDNKLEGIISFGYGCTNFNHYGVYTRIYSYLDWIQHQTVRSNSHYISQFYIFWICLFNIIVQF